MVYVLSGKGSVAGSDLARIVIEKCQDAGVLWDSDLPAYTLDFATQIPSVSKSIREGNENAVIEAINARLHAAEATHDSYLILCLTAHQLISRLDTRMTCLDLWKAVEPRLQAGAGPIAYLGTLESLPQGESRFLTLPDHVDRMGDLITSVKRGYARLGESYAAHPRHLLETIVDQFQKLGATRFFVACTDLHACKSDLVKLGISTDDIFDIVEVAADAVLQCAGRRYTLAFLDALSDARTLLRYKYVAQSDSLHTDEKTHYLDELLARLTLSRHSPLQILDVGGSATGHALRIARQLENGHAEITLLDVSQASLEAAQFRYASAKNVSTTFVHGDIQSFSPSHLYNTILCLGVLLYVSSDTAFRSTLARIAQLLTPGGFLLTRDSLHDAPEKTYMAFGGVIRNRVMYERAFNEVGLELLDSNEFIIDQSIRRTILTAVWKKRD